MPENRKQDAEAIYQAVSLGLLFPVAIAVGYFLGRWLDGLLHIRPWLTIICTGLGVAAAFVNLFRAGLSGDGSSGNPTDGKQ